MVFYVLELIKLAQQLESYMKVDYNFKLFKYEITLHDIYYKESKSYARFNIAGYGFTIEDAAYDYIRKCRGGSLANEKTNKEIEPS